MTDRREAILARLLVLAKDLPGLNSAARNLDEIPEGKRPAVQIFDADEREAEGFSEPGHRSGASELVTMSPHIVISVGASAETVGSELNALRVALLKAIFADTGPGGLIELVGAGSNVQPKRNGSIRYLECSTALGHGRTMEGSMGISIEFTYPLILKEL
jgi:hypothetical protein